MSNLKVIVFNVKQGDHILLELPDGKIGIIDCKLMKIGIDNKNIRFSPAEAYIQHRLNSGTPPVVAFILLSHNDTDHIDGINRLLKFLIDNEVCVEKIHYSGYIEYLFSKEIGKVFANADSSDKWYPFVKRIIDHQKGLEQLHYNNTDKLKKIAGNANFDRGRLVANQKLHSTDLKIMCLSPKNERIESFTEELCQNLMEMLTPFLFREEMLLQEDQCPVDEFNTLNICSENLKYSVDRNQISIVLRIRYKDHSLIFTGDTPPKALEESIAWLDNNGYRKNLSTGNFIKASHHGSRYSSSHRLWEIIAHKTRKLYVAVSAGTQYKHPNKELIDHIQHVKGDNYELHCTNSCSCCLQKKEHLFDNNFAWFDDYIRTLPTDRDGIDISNPITPKTNPSGQKGLAAWIYTFEPLGEPSVSIGTSSYIDVYKKCPAALQGCAAQ